MNRGAKVRAVVACFGLVCCFTGFSFRLIYIQVTKHDAYTQLAVEKHVIKIPIFARRGIIQDVHGEILAANEPLKTVVADGTLVTNPSKLAAALADLLEIKATDIEEKISVRRHYIVLKKEVPESITGQIAKRLEQGKLKGITFEQDARRTYPNGSMLCHVLGFMSRENGGVQGVELTMDRYLHGYDGFRYIEKDRTGKELVPYRGQEHQACDGYNVRLTIDMGLQNIVETELDALFKQYRPEMATAIMMEPQTGRVMAMANRPNFDPNRLDECEPAQMKNCAVINMVEPGSIFKIVTASGALNDKVVTPDTIVPVDGGCMIYAGKKLHDHGHGDHPDLTWTDVLVKSSNIGAAKLAMRLGEQRFYEYIRSFGFGERTGINLPGEISGMVAPPYKWSKISITRIPMGQGVGVTPIQMVAAMSAVANGGKLMMPQIIDAVVDKDNNPIVSYPPVVVRQVVNPETTVKVRAALEGVVSKRGTAFLAMVPGFRAGGKTGTANKPAPHGGYYDDRYVTSFIGFLPVEDPKFVCLIMLDNPKASGEQMYGGVLAGPAFSHIGEKAARYLNLQPELMPINPADSEMKLTKSQ